MISTTLLHGDCLTRLRELPDASVHCCITSPPYWGLRDYGTATWEGGDQSCDHKQEAPKFNGPKQTKAQVSGHASKAESHGRNQCHKCGAYSTDSQLGLEPTPEEYVANMVAVFREVRRVLRDDGTLWLNLGDSYCTVPHGPKGANTFDPKLPQARKRDGCAANRLPQQGLKHKDLVGIPWAVAFALRADGWYLRQDIVWAKPNPMPESVTDRCTKAHEYLFLLAKSERYFYDNVAIYEPFSDERMGNPGVYKKTSAIERKATNERQDSGFINNGGVWTNGESVGGRNKRDVWTITTQPYPGSHFATFPPKLIEPCILAGTSDKGCCPKCGAPWERMVEADRVPTRPGTDSKVNRASKHDDSPYHDHAEMVVGNRDPQRHCTETRTIGWEPGCECGNEDLEPPIPCTVLDPFAGSGTTLATAFDLGRSAIGIELNKDYIALAQSRIDEIRSRSGLFAVA